MGISNSMFTAVTGLDTFGTALSIVSDNIANANSTGFKSGTARFGDLVSGYYATQAAEPQSQGTGTSLLGVATDFTTGPTVHTGTWSNAMIQGNGFFSVRDTNNTTLYTRDGSFRVDATGQLTNMNGYEVLGSDGNPIQVDDPAAPAYVGYEINNAGEIYGTPSGGGTRVLIGTLMLTTFPNQEGLIRNGSNMYTPGADAGTPVTNAGGTNTQAGEVIAGALEGSNVDLAEQMVNMIIYQSDYTANSKAITTANNMLDTVVNLVR
ncbi:MAG: flagellar hook basal-body protein [Syntrophobacteraceae bacterium]